MRKVKRHPPSVALEVSVPDVIMKNQVDDLSRHEVLNLKDELERSCSNDGTSIGVETSTSRGKSNAFIGGPASW